ncbi:diaminopimelate epimerase [Methyloradius palustris]|uniref:Diaminopimelate epimerase n=1 Tax=Methyloradius palustris TaxID=2778876 RepID=A0A8D5G0H7_9PROT|nr:diaminopimelate epimerase [Methyloradius palustris]BCM23888.1 diaminopimelate epimerase [Methyloradius palustris]
MNIKFTKMHGIGNDFVVIDAYSSVVSLSANQIRAIADRHFGIGCDQLLLVEKSTLPNVDFRYRIFNADGSEVEQCGNGARCFVRFVHDKHLTEKNEIRVETMRGIITLTLENNGQVTVNMGPPRFNPDQIPFIADAPAETYSLDVGGEEINISAVSMGNPHAVQIVANTGSAPVALQGPLIEAHPRFPEHVNAGFMQIIDDHHIRLRVFERGSGETLACGSGACAAVVAGIKLGLLNSPVNVSMRGGELNIVWNGNNSDVMMTGPAEPVFDGELDLSRIDTQTVATQTAVI